MSATHQELKNRLAKALSLFLNQALLAREQALSRLQLGRKEMLVLQHVHHNEPARISELTARLNMRASNFATLLGQMEDLRLVNRKSDPENRRIKLVTLTDKGRRVLAQFDLLYLEMADALAPPEVDLHTLETLVLSFESAAALQAN